MSHHSEQKLHILSDNNLQTGTNKKIRLKLKLVSHFLVDPKITTIVLWEFYGNSTLKSFYKVPAEDSEDSDVP